MDTNSDSPETIETLAPEPAAALSPKGIAAMQGLDEDIAQAEEAKAEAIEQAEAALREGRLEDADKMLGVAEDADSAMANMKLEQLAEQTEPVTMIAPDASSDEPSTTLDPVEEQAPDPADRQMTRPSTFEAKEGSRNVEDGMVEGNYDIAPGGPERG